MATVLALSSMVARGHVGLAAIVPALQRLGHDVIALPTVMLSNQPGHAHWAGLAVPPERLAAMLDALDANGWLRAVDAVLTGYLPTPGHVRFACDLISRVRSRRPAAEVFCDPVIGDAAEGLYIEVGAAAAVRDDLVGLADYASPNLFELGWLTGRTAATLTDVRAAAHALRVPATIITSVPVNGEHLANMLVTRKDAYLCSAPKLAAVPHGTGDFFIAVFVALCLEGGDTSAHLGAATAAVSALAAASAGRDELALAASADLWHRAPAFPVERLSSADREAH